ncbi:unnamed protein product, partial [Closterium sp. NIES-53]
VPSSPTSMSKGRNLPPPAPPTPPPPSPPSPPPPPPTPLAFHRPSPDCFRSCNAPLSDVDLLNSFFLCFTFPPFALLAAAAGSLDMHSPLLPFSL